MPVRHPAPSGRTDDRPRYAEASADRQPFILQIENLVYRYPDGQRALQGVTVRVRRSEKVALVGPNGAGKSTLLLHTNGILQGEGLVQVAELPLASENLGEVRAQVGMVFQNPDDQLFSPTVFEDVAFGPLHMGLSEETVHERVSEALAAVGMAEFGPRLSYRLSMGEKKRVAIATVLSMRPEILVLDEPTAGLDPRARRSLIDLLAGLPLTILAATHDLDLVRELFPRMIILEDGRVVADGPSTSLLEDRPLLELHGLV